MGKRELQHSDATGRDSDAQYDEDARDTRPIRMIVPVEPFVDCDADRQSQSHNRSRDAQHQPHTENAMPPSAEPNLSIAGETKTWSTY